MSCRTLPHLSQSNRQLTDISIYSRIILIKNEGSTLVGRRNHEELLQEIISLELRMFMAIEPTTPSFCQEQPEAFKLMRRSNYEVLSDETLASYLNDLEEAMEEGRNLVELKYARIDNLITPLNNNPLIDRIVEIEEKWLKELEKEYPLTFTSKADFAAGVYLRSELETYSDRTLELYYRDTRKALEEGRNLTAERYTYLFRQTGYTSIDDVENERRSKRTV